MSNAVKLTERFQKLLDFLPLQGTGKCRQDLESWSCSHGITYRQVLRDLKHLEADGYVTGRLKGNAKIWLRVQIRPSWHGMTREQAFILLLVEKKMRHLLPDNLLQALQFQWDAANKKLSRPEYRTDQSWFDKIRSLPPLLMPPKVLDKVLTPVINALLNEHWLMLDYENQYREERSADVMPLGLAERESIYYLIVLFKGYTDIRHIRLDRVSLAKELEEPFQYPLDFDLKSYIDSGVFNYVTGDKIQLEMLMEPNAANHLIDSPLAQDQILEPLPDGRIRVSAKVHDSERLFWWILGFGRSVEILKPENLRNNLLEEIEAMRLRYRG